MPAARHTLRGLGAQIRAGWHSKGAISTALLPLSLLFGGLAAAHRQLFRWRLLRVVRVRAAVIVVGNITAGGAGKTPTVVEIVAHLLRNGLQVGVVSRGYGRRDSACVEVQAGDTAQRSGDEPVLLKRALGIPVFVHANRARAAQALLAQHPHTQVIVCDDGLQHYGLHRDLEVCVVDADGFGNGRLLPAGPLRQRWPRTLVAHCGQSEDRTLVLHSSGAAWPGRFSAHRTLSPQLRDAQGQVHSLAALADATQPICAVAAIAKPQAFFAMLRLHGLKLAHTLALPDHDDYADFAQLASAFPQDALLICTQKDAPKLWPQRPLALAAVLEQRSEAAFFTALDGMLARHTRVHTAA